MNWWLSKDVLSDKLLSNIKTVPYLAVLTRQSLIQNKHAGILMGCKLK